MGACTSFAKCMLIFLNVVVAIVGFILLGAGITILVMKDRVNDILKSVTDFIPDAPGAVGIKDAASSTSELVIDLGPLLNPIGIAMTIMGAFLFLLCIFGCCGACCSNRVCLGIYITIMCILLLIQIILVSLFFSDKFDEDIQEQLKTTIKDDYGGIDTFNLWSITWNVLMLELKCCGVVDYNDFTAATNWKRTREIEYSGFTATRTLVTPVACCLMKGSFPNVEPEDEQCATTPTDLNNNWKTGCWQKIKDQADQYNTYVIIGCVVAFVFQALLILFAFLICCETNNKVV